MDGENHGTRCTYTVMNSGVVAWPHGGHRHGISLSYRVQSAARAVDSEVAQRLAAQETYRMQDQAYLLDALDQRGHLRTDKTREGLTHDLWLAAAPELAIKSLDAGWSLERHTTWLAGVLAGLLLKPAL